MCITKRVQSMHDGKHFKCRQPSGHLIISVLHYHLWHHRLITQNIFTHFNPEDKKNNCCLKKLFQVAIWFLSGEQGALRVERLPSRNHELRSMNQRGDAVHSDFPIAWPCLLSHRMPDEEALPGYPCRCGFPFFVFLFWINSLLYYFLF